MRNRTIPLALTLAVVAGCDLDLTDLDPNCGATERLDRTIDARDAEVLFVDAAAGSLTVRAVSGTDRVRIEARACADRRDAVDRIDLFVDDDGLGTISVLADVPTRDNARLDLEIEVPDWMSLDAIDGSGHVEVDGVVHLLLDDLSGDVTVTDVPGDVRIYDDSGHIVVRRVGDDVWISDDSGNIDVEDVGGDLTVAADGSGTIRHRNVRGVVRLP